MAAASWPHVSFHTSTSHHHGSCWLVGGRAVRYNEMTHRTGTGQGNVWEWYSGGAATRTANLERVGCSLGEESSGIPWRLL